HRAPIRAHKVAPGGALGTLVVLRPRLHHRARALVASRGFDVPQGLPPVDAARWVRARCPSDAADALVELAWLYYEVHLGRGDVGSAAPIARQLLDRVRSLPDGVTHRR
ncbi:MAG: hypothetical protein ABMA64_39060, partial [Myxococcota bacterium]